MGGATLATGLVSLHVDGFEVVPGDIIGHIASLRHGGIHMLRAGFEDFEVIAGRTLRCGFAFDAEVLGAIVFHLHHLLARGKMDQALEFVGEDGFDARADVIGC